MKQIAFIPLLVALSQQVQAQVVDRGAYLKGFEERIAYVTSFYDTMQTAGYYQIAVRYAHNKDIARADKMFAELLREPRGDIFWMIPSIGAFLHGKKEMSAATHALVRNAWKTYAPYRGDTENHWC